MKPNGIAGVLVSAIRICRENRISFLSASIAFYAFSSVVPILLLFVAVASLLGATDPIVSSIRIYLSSEGEQVLTRALSGSTGRIGASTVGLLALLWSALKVFRGINIAFDKVYGSKEATPFHRRLLKGGFVLVGIATGIFTVAGTRFAVTRVSTVGATYVGLLERLVLLGGLLALLVPVYYVMPPVSVRFRDVVPGTVVAVFGWVVLQVAFRIYAENALQYQAYGIIGAVFLFLLWLYLGTIVLLFGASVNAAAVQENN